MKKTKFLVMSLVLSVLMMAAGVLFAACDNGEEDPPATHTHTWSTEWSSDEDNHWHACTGEDCDAVNDEAAHTWDGGEVTTPATFEAPGVMTYTCTVCDATKTEDIAQLEHTYATEWSHDGDNHWHACTDEGYEDLKADVAAHDWDSGEVTTPATFEAPGVMTYTCTVCDATKTEDIAQLEHTYATEWSHDGDNHWHACTDEGYEDLKADVAAHTWDGGEVTTPATFEAPGVMTYTCVCGAIKTEAIAQLEHAFSDEWSYTTTHHWHACIDEGYDLPLGDNNYAFLRKDEAYHSFGEGVLSEDGTYKTYTCVCGYSKTSTVTTTQSGDVVDLNEYTAEATQYFQPESNGIPFGADVNQVARLNGDVYAMAISGGEVVKADAGAMSSSVLITSGGLRLDTDNALVHNDAGYYMIFLPKIDFRAYQQVSIEVATNNAPYIGLTNSVSERVAFSGQGVGSIVFIYNEDTATLDITLTMGANKRTVSIDDAGVISGAKRATFYVWNMMYSQTHIGVVKGVVAIGGSVEEYPVYLFDDDMSNNEFGRESEIGRTDIVDGKSVYWKNGIYCYNTAADEYKIVETSTVYENGVAVHTQTGDVEAAFADCIIYMPLINFSTYQNVSFKVKGNDAGHIGNLKLGDQSLALGAYEATFTCVYDEGSVTVTVRLNDPSGSQIMYTITDPDVVSGAAAFTFTVEGGAYGQIRISPIINTVTLA